VRILVVSNGFPPRGRWGTEFYTKELVRGLSARGHELFVLHPERSGERPRYTLEEVGQQFSVTRERIRQIEVRAFEKLQNKMRALASEKGMLTSA